MRSAFVEVGAYIFIVGASLAVMVDMVRFEAVNWWQMSACCSSCMGPRGLDYPYIE